MRKTFKKYFIPHEENDHKPHFLREETTAKILSSVLLFELVFFFYAFVVIPNSSYLAVIFTSVLTDLTNENRTQFNIPTLKINSVLEQAATRKAEDMARVGYFSHNGPDGKTPWAWLNESGYAYRFAGENLAVNFIDSGDVVTAWMNSPGHRKNILDNRFTEIGLGSAQGVYQGRKTIFVVQFFGRPIIDQPAALASIEPNPIVMAPPKPKEALTVKPAPQKPTEENKPVPTNTTVAGSEATTPLVPAQNSSLLVTLEKISTSPNTILNRIFLGLVGIFIIALALTIGTKVILEHPRLILNGSLVIAVLLGFLILNRYIALANIGI